MIVSWDPPVIDQRNGNISYYQAILTPLQPGEEKIVRNVSFPFFTSMKCFSLIFLIDYLKKKHYAN